MRYFAVSNKCKNDLIYQKNESDCNRDKVMNLLNEDLWGFHSRDSERLNSIMVIFKNGPNEF